MRTMQFLKLAGCAAVASLVLGVSAPGARTDVAVSGWAQGTATQPSSGWPAGTWTMTGSFDLAGLGDGTYVGKRSYTEAFDRCSGAPYCYSVSGKVTFTTESGNVVARIDEATSNMQDWPNALSDLSHDLNLTIVHGTRAYGGAKGTLHWRFIAIPSTSTYWCWAFPTCPGGTPSLWYDGNPFVGGAGETSLEGEISFAPGHSVSRTA